MYLNTKKHQVLRNFRKNARKLFVYTIASDDVIPGKQTRKQATGMLSETLDNT